MTTVTLQDVRAVKICSAGARAFCVRHNLDWTSFLKQGFQVEELEHIDDAMLRQVVEVARGRG